MPTITSEDVDIVLLDHAQLDTFIDLVGTPQPDDDLMIFTDDDHTRGRCELNLISFESDAFSDPDREYGIATQLHHPVGPTDTALDFRQGRSTDTTL